MNFKILSIDYGSIRTGIAISDPLQLIATGLTSIKTRNLIKFLNNYIYEENIQKIIIGESRNIKNILTLLEKEIQFLIKKIYISFPDIHVERIDERFTTKISKKTLVGIKKKYRKNKFILDKISATLILQSYLDKKNGFTY